MNISDLVKQLSQLQLEQNKIIEQILAARDTTTLTEPEDTIHIGDHVLLLTGIRCIKGDRARVTKVTESAVHFTVIRNNHNTYKKHRNVQKIVA